MTATKYKTIINNTDALCENSDEFQLLMDMEDGFTTGQVDHEQEIIDEHELASFIIEDVGLNPDDYVPKDWFEEVFGKSVIQVAFTKERYEEVFEHALAMIALTGVKASLHIEGGITYLFEDGLIEETNGA